VSCSPALARSRRDCGPSRSRNDKLAMTAADPLPDSELAGVAGLQRRRRLGRERGRLAVLRDQGHVAGLEVLGLVARDQVEEHRAGRYRQAVRRRDRRHGRPRGDEIEVTLGAGSAGHGRKPSFLPLNLHPKPQPLQCGLDASGQYAGCLDNGSRGLITPECGGRARSCPRFRLGPARSRQARLRWPRTIGSGQHASVPTAKPTIAIARNQFIECVADPPRGEVEHPCPLPVRKLARNAQRSFGFYIGLAGRDEREGIRAVGIDAELLSKRTSLGQLDRNVAKVAAAITSADETATALTTNFRRSPPSCSCFVVGL